MTGDDRDLPPVVREAIDELRRLPAADGDAIRRVVSAAAAVRVTPAADEPLLARPRRSVRIWTAAGLAAAAGFLGFAFRGALTDRATSHSVTESSPVAAASAVTTRPASMTTGEALPTPHLFVLNDRRAHHVSVVGDFNQWNATRAPMTRSPNSDLWSVTIPILPGRHTYRFIVDDSLLMLDPRAPRARDPDLGAEGSVVIVGRP